MTGRALEKLLRRAEAVPALSALWTHETIRPTHLYEGFVALVFCAVARRELGHAQPLLELHLIACHRHLPELPLSLAISRLHDQMRI